MCIMVIVIGDIGDAIVEACENPTSFSHAPADSPAQEHLNFWAVSRVAY